MKILIIGGGIGGLTTAIALGRKGLSADVIEKDPDWSVYGVGIIQQSNVIRAVAALGILDEYLGAGFGFDHVEVYTEQGELAARIPSPKLADGYPANVGIGRPALQKVLADNAKKAGANIRLGVTVTAIDEDAGGADVQFSDGSTGRYDAVISADGLYSQTRQMLFPDAKGPEFSGQSVWRYNFKKPKELDCLRAFDGSIGTGLTPLSNELMYMYVTTPEPDNPWYERDGLAARLRGRLANAAPQIKELASQITDDAGVVYKPLEWHFLEGPWHKGRVVLIGDAVHGTTPHLGQGAGMAIEEAVVIADELSKCGGDVGAAFLAYHARMHDRCKFIVDTSVSICMGQLGKGPKVDQATATRKMFEITAQPL